MHSLKELYKFGNGPSSSHTMAPKRATLLFMEKYPNVDFVKVELFGSLALTGKGHLTDYIIDKTLGDLPHEIVFNFKDVPPHPNTMNFYGYEHGKEIVCLTILSIGGGSISVLGYKLEEIENVYPHKKFYDIKKYCKEHNLKLHEYVYKFDKGIKEYLEDVYTNMLKAIDRGLSLEGVIHGDLGVVRKAKQLYQTIKEDDPKHFSFKQELTAYAFAVAEENATGGEIVTAPTCGACGVLPACLKFMLKLNKYTHEEFIDALAVAGLIGNIVKFNASISGAEAGCQAEIGTACSMAAAFLAQLYGLDANSIDQAAEIALEHHLGLTCDPIMGYVQIPCIERNAVAALRAFDAADMAKMLDSDEAKISFDLVCRTMYETGKDLIEHYRETSTGGLARHYTGE